MKSEFEWVASIATEEANAALSSPLREELLALDEEGRLWLRASTNAEDAELLFACFKDVDAYRLSGQSLLVPYRETVPSRSLPVGSWLPVTEVVQTWIPSGRLSKTSIKRADLVLARTNTQRVANLLICTLEQFAQWVEETPNNRWKDLLFSADGRRRVFVKGDRLPTIAADYFLESDGIAVPIGFRFSPNLSHQTVGGLFAIESDGLVVFRQDEVPLVCNPIDFVRVQRSAIRQTNRKLDCDV